MMSVIKDTFKPNFTNIFVALLIFFLFNPIIYYDNGIRCITVPCDNVSLATLLNYISYAHLNTIYGVSYSLLFAGSILSYLLSCIIVYLFGLGFKPKKIVENYKKKKKRR